MKVYRTSDQNSVLFFVPVVTVFGIFWVIGWFREMPGQMPGGLPVSYAILLLGSLFIIYMVMALVYVCPFRIEIEDNGIVSIRSLVHTRERLRLSEITRVVLDGPPYVGISLSNWEASGGDIIIEHGQQKTKLGRFPDDEDFITQMTLANSAIQIVRLKRQE